MSSTSNSQNLLVNVFRPTYVYDAEKGYIPKLTVSNVDSVVGTSGTFSNLNVGDTKSNVYIGVNAGNPNTVVESCNSTGITAIGLSAGSNTSNSDGSVFLGNSTGSNTSNVDNSVYLGALTGTYNSNCANSVYIGYNSAKNLSNASNEVAIGTNTIAGGTSNVYIGASTGSAGSSNIFIGPNIAPGNVSNQLRVGTGSNIAIYGDLTAQKVGINTVPTTGFDVSGQAYFNNKVGMQCNAPRFSLDVEGQAYASGGILIGEGSAAAPAIALADELSTGIFAASNVSEGRSFGFSIKGVPKVTVTDTCLNVLANLYVQGTFGAATQFGNNQIVTGWLRGPDSNGGNFDVSQSGISVGKGTVNIGKGFITDVCTNGYIRMMNDGGAIQIDMSGGIISNSATTRSSNFIGTSATASNQIGGVTLSNNNISYSGTLTGSTANTSNQIGGVTLSNNNISYSGTITGSSANTSNQIGGVTLSNNNISYSGTITGSTANASNQIGGVTLSNNNISYSGTITGSTANTSNQIGGVTLSNNNISYSGTITGSTATASNQIGGVTLSNNNVSYSGTITGSTANTSNRIGGVVLSNTDVSATGRILGGTTTSNFIGGVVLSNTRIGVGTTAPDFPLVVSSSTAATHGVFSNPAVSGEASVTVAGAAKAQDFGIKLLQTPTIHGLYTADGTLPMTFSTNATERMRIHPTNGNVGINQNNPQYTLDVNGTGRFVQGVTLDSTITGSTANTSNRIGGVVLSNNDISYSGTITGSTANTSNRIGGVVLSNTDVSVTGRILAGTTTSNFIGGVVLSNTDVSVTGRILGGTTTSNNIGGVTLSNARIGIGDSAPVYPLVVTSSTLIPQAVISNTSGEANLTVAGNRAQDFGIKLLSTTNAQGLYTADGTAPMTFSTYGQERMRITAAGNIGIGTDAPGYPLVVSSSTAATHGVFSNPSGSGEASVTVAGAGKAQDFGIKLIQTPTIQGLYTADGTLPMTFSTNATERIRITTDGKVGIGMTNPVRRLDISSDQGSGGVRVTCPNALFDAFDPRNGNTNSLQLYQNQVTGNQGLYTNSSTIPIVFWTANTIRMTILGTGNVGIGTTAPEQTLHVNGNIRMGGGGGDGYRQFILSGGNTFGYIYSAYAKYGDGIHMGYNYYNDNTRDVIPSPGGQTSRITFGYGYVGIYTGDISEVPTRLGYYQNSVGNVGIGTTTPQNPLVVNSGVSVAIQVLSSTNGAVRVTGSGLADSNGFQIFHNSGENGIYDCNTLPLNIYRNGSKQITVLSNGLTGFGTTTPAYRLDAVADATSNASINMSTWPRANISNVAFGRGAVDISGNCIRWSNFTQSMDSTLMTITHDAANGSYFQILKSGIWGISLGFWSVGSNNELFIDCSTNFRYGGGSISSATTNIIAWNGNPSTFGGLSYIGYLPSNSSLYYKFKCSQNNIQNSNVAFCRMTFVSELNGTVNLPGTFP